MSIKPFTEIRCDWDEYKGSCGSSQSTSLMSQAKFCKHFKDSHWLFIDRYHFCPYHAHQINNGNLPINNKLAPIIQKYLDSSRKS